ncbi:hypothetical protein FOA52_012373 [Chlamydomonas sp. UWO 241]|nr:hypothetical protein FOA52_012373 [Chlamydomonas sp. UWO 241]
MTWVLVVGALAVLAAQGVAARNGLRAATGRGHLLQDPSAAFPFCKCDRSPSSSPWRAAINTVVPAPEVGGERVSLSLYADPSLPCVRSLHKLKLRVGSQAATEYYRGVFKAKNIFWQVGTSGSLQGSTVFEGTMVADQSITSGTGATVHGRLLARIASVTMQSAEFSLPA